ncbi:MAG TPA: alpha/beta hydrolase [Caulobacteraceae bacterium]|jgi:pimeloyl-ACP methyl ester carboxylesterase|nr:alpha/beta hydrolase [Caulobacteraceae bacterium]
MADDQLREASPLQRIDEDEPFRLTPDMPPEIASPLAAFKGAPPASPAWFDEAIAKAPERSFVTVGGVRIELLTWGERGKPGLIFVHGNSAHADWWSFIAPFFAADYRVAALSLSGMGASDWRETYSFDIFAEEIFACATAAGLYEAAAKPVYIGHSFGGAQVLNSAIRHPERMSACILVDTGFGGPPTPEEFEAMRKEAEAKGEDLGRWQRLSQRSGRNRIYPTLEAALTRFRFMPPQVPGNLYIADFIARRSLKRAPLEGEGGGEGWTWRFDPGVWAKLDRSGMGSLQVGPDTAPLVHIYGDHSEIIRRHSFQGKDGSRIPAAVPTIVIPDSEHHIMVDQPLALVAALRALLATWAPRGAAA